MNRRDYRDYPQDVLEAINDTAAFVEGMDFASFTRGKKTVSAVIRSIEVIGEATKKIPKSLKDRYVHIPWKKMAGMRDKLIHEYFGVDLEILWQVVKEDIPSLESPFKIYCPNFRQRKTALRNQYDAPNSVITPWTV